MRGPRLMGEIIEDEDIDTHSEAVECFEDFGMAVIERGIISL